MPDQDPPRCLPNENSHDEYDDINMLQIFRAYRFLLYLFVALLLSFVSTSSVGKSIVLEKSICGLKEPFLFWLWSNAAGRPDPSRISDIENIEDISITTKDSRILRGYKLKASSPKGYLLVAQGNAMLADQIIKSFQEFASTGYDVYLFDYRGYGRSEGKRRLRAILSDFGEIIDHLNSLSYSNRLFYGMSFGGIVLLDALKGKSGKKRMVIDSTPSRLSDYGCPEVHDPVRNVPKDCSNMLVIVGHKDTVVKPAMSKELSDTALKRGASILRDPELAHPFMDRDISLHNRRMRTVKSFLLNER